LHKPLSLISTCSQWLIFVLFHLLASGEPGLSSNVTV
jgi:hypothetical protein